MKAEDVWSFRRSNYFEHVGAEAKGLRGAAGLIDLSPFSKFLIKGPGAEAWLNGLLANRVPQKDGGMALCHALTSAGGVRSEFTITRFGENDYYAVSSGAAERFDWGLAAEKRPRRGRGAEEHHDRAWHPRARRPAFARDILAPLASHGLDNDAFPWLSARMMEVAGYGDVRALRVNFVGELGWELHLPWDSVAPVFDALVEEGAPHGLVQAGMRAMDVLRIEKSYRMWAKT